MSELYLAHKLLTEEKLEGLPHLQAELIREWKNLEHKLMLHATMLDEKDALIIKLGEALHDVMANEATLRQLPPRDDLLWRNERLYFHYKKCVDKANHALAEYAALIKEQNND